MFRRIAQWLAALALLMPLTAQAQSGALQGTVLDAASGAPLVGAEVAVLQTGQRALTDGQGRYVLPAEPGDWTVWVAAGDAQGIFAHQRPDGRPAVLNIMGSTPERPRLQGLEHYGWPGASGRVPLKADVGPVSLRDFWGVPDLDALGLTMPTPLPATVRVARRFASTCRGNPIQRIDEVPLEEYVHGVLLPEIGVFRSAATGKESSRDVFKAFAVAARTYALYFVVAGTNNDEGYDLDDTACNQRYDDQRDPWIEALVAETAGQVLVRRGTETEFDKFEYAASCGRHSTWPEYQDGYVSDGGLSEVCVGSWCGHNSCAAHQDNPDVPGDDRCLVRGVCQWGSLERSAAGQDYRAILTHYQPGLEIRDYTIRPPEGGKLRGFVRTGADLDTGEPVPGAEVGLDTGENQRTSDTGYFEFDAVAAGSRALSVEATGFVSATETVDVVDGAEVWGSVLLVREAMAPDMDPEPGVVPQPDPDPVTPNPNPDPLPNGPEPPVQEPEMESDSGFPLIGRAGAQPGGCTTAPSAPSPLWPAALVGIAWVLFWCRRD